MNDWLAEDDEAEREKAEREEAEREAEEPEEGSLDPDKLTVEPAWWDEGGDDDLISSLAERAVRRCPRCCGSIRDLRRAHALASAVLVHPGGVIALAARTACPPASTFEPDQFPTLKPRSRKRSSRSSGSSSIFSIVLVRRAVGSGSGGALSKARAAQ